MELNQLINTFSTTAQCSSIKRYSRDLVVNKESLLSHVGWVSMWCVFAGDSLSAASGIQLDYGKLLRRAVLHDIDELGTGDVPRTTKYASPMIREELGVVERQFVGLIEYQLQLKGKSIFDDWENAKDKDTIEGVLLKYADLAAVVYKVWDEVIVLNNYGFMRVATEIKEFLQEKSKIPDWLALSERANMNAVHWFVQLEESLLEIVNEAIKIVNGRQKMLGTIDLTLKDA